MTKSQYKVKETLTDSDPHTDLPHPPTIDTTLSYFDYMRESNIVFSLMGKTSLFKFLHLIEINESLVNALLN